MSNQIYSNFQSLYPHDFKIADVGENKFVLTSQQNINPSTIARILYTPDTITTPCLTFETDRFVSSVTGLFLLNFNFEFTADNVADPYNADIEIRLERDAVQSYLSWSGRQSPGHSGPNTSTYYSVSIPVFLYPGDEITVDITQNWGGPDVLNVRTPNTFLLITGNF